MITLELIEENSGTCPVDSATNTTTTSGAPVSGGGIPLILLGAVGVITVVGLVATAGKNKGVTI